MKKLFILFLSMLLTFGCVINANAALSAPTTSFSVAKISHKKHVTELTLTFSVPAKKTGGKLLVCFYTGGRLTQFETYDISSTTTFSKQIITYEKTPDEIKVFTLYTKNIKPLTMSGNMLTQTVIKNANTDVVKKLFNVSMQATDHLREHWIEDTDTEIHAILDEIDFCLESALAYQNTHLLTSEFVRSTYRTELLEIQDMYTKAPEKQRNKLANIITDPSLDDDYYWAFSYMQKFLDVNFK